MTISFVIPAYNADKTIERCLKSITAACALIPGSEIIVVNNGSDDETEKLALSYNVRLIQLPRRSRSMARNLGWKSALSPWIAFIDADVEIHSDWARDILETCNVAGCAGGQGPIHPAPCFPNSLSDFRNKSAQLKTRGSFSSLHIVSFETPMINTAACLYRREALKQVNGFDETLRRHEDIDLSKKIVLQGWSFRSCSKASALVYWDGAGWSGYLYRAFIIGKTKSDYNAKWFPLRSALLEAKIILNEFKRLLKVLMNYQKTGDFFYAQKLIVDSFQVTGKLVFFLSYWRTKSSFKANQGIPNNLPSTVSKYKVSKYFRIIDLEKEMHLLNVEINQVLILESSVRGMLLKLIGWESGQLTEEELTYLEAQKLVQLNT